MFDNNNLKFIFLLLLFSFASYTLKGQIKKNEGEGEFHVLEAAVFEGDTIGSVDLQEIVVFPNLRFDNKRERRKYTKLIRDLKKVYPYAMEARNRLMEMEWEFRQLETDKERRAYVKKVEKELKEEFKDDVKDLTISQGRLLLKLIDRETGQTSFTILHEIKGGFSAVFWQTIARVFGHDLKAEYDPDGRDRLIERIVVMIEHDQL